MKLPEKNKEVTLPLIKEICVAYGLTELRDKIKKNPPKNTFKSDGCSMWFDTWKVTNQVNRLKVKGF